MTQSDFVQAIDKCHTGMKFEEPAEGSFGHTGNFSDLS